MIKEIKCEKKLFGFFTYLYVTFSFLYIGKKVYDNETRDDSFPFNIGYFVVILLIHLKLMKYIVSKIKMNEYDKSMNYLGWMFILMGITTGMIWTVDYYDGTYYQKIADINTLVSSLIYQFIVLYTVFFRISKKMYKKMMEYNYNQQNTGDPHNIRNDDGSAVAFNPSELV